MITLSQMAVEYLTDKAIDIARPFEEADVKLPRDMYRDIVKMVLEEINVDE